MALGLLLFLVNIVKTARSGPRAVNDPWLGDTLEWYTKLSAAAAQLRPPPVHHERAAAARPAAFADREPSARA